jgi:hypothetical protein
MRRGQLSTLEPVLIVIFLVIIVGILLLFSTALIGDRSANDKLLLASDADLRLLKRITHMPELSCPSSETGETYCIDLYKAAAFANQDVKSYRSLFGPTRITVQYLDLDTGQWEQPIVLYNDAGQDVRASQTFSTVFDPLTQTRHFALISVERAT